jgi:hypothetical protein
MSCCGLHCFWNSLKVLAENLSNRGLSLRFNLQMVSTINITPPKRLRHSTVVCGSRTLVLAVIGTLSKENGADATDCPVCIEIVYLLLRCGETAVSALRSWAYCTITMWYRCGPGRRDRLGLSALAVIKDICGASRRWAKEWEFSLFIPVGHQGFFYMP